MKNEDLYNEDNEATYCPEDDKLRLYVGRVPRDEYEALRKEGWTSTPKQDCDFVAVWSVSRENTALSYAGVITDEDQGPDERAADRAERFGGYLDKRLDEATGHADRYDSQSQYHGNQDKGRAARAADRHDRIASKAVNAWDKAEYWQRRTSGVISHALYVSSPAVRMGRIKTIEADLRKLEKSWLSSTETAQARFDSMLSVVEHAAGTREKLVVSDMPDFRYELSKMRQAEGLADEEKSTPEQLRRAVIVSVLSGWNTSDHNKTKAEEARKGTRPAADIAKEWTDKNPRPEAWNPESSRAVCHLKLRLAYEYQMLEAQGGRAAMVEMEVGGFIGKYQIRKVNKSKATGRVVSVTVRAEGNRWGRHSEPGEWHLHVLNIERLSTEVYRAPTEADKEALKAQLKAEKSKVIKVSCPLVNPTLEDAQKLQGIWNAKASKTPDTVKPSEPWLMTMGEYKARSGNYGDCKTTIVCETGGEPGHYYGTSTNRAEVFKVRKGHPGGSYSMYLAYRVVVITDKPQKALPWAALEAAKAACPSVESMTPKLPEIAALIESCRGSYRSLTKEEAQLELDAQYVGWMGRTSGHHWTDAGLAAYRANQTVNA